MTQRGATTTLHECGLTYTVKFLKFIDEKENNIMPQDKFINNSILIDNPIKNATIVSV